MSSFGPDNAKPPTLQEQLESLASLIQTAGYTHPHDLRRHLQTFWDLRRMEEGYSPGDEIWDYRERFLKREALCWLQDFGWRREKDIGGAEMLQLVERALKALSPAKTPTRWIPPYNDV